MSTSVAEISDGTSKNSKQTREESQKLQNKINFLNSRCSGLNQKLNEAIAKNKQQRLKIDKCRKERVVFDKIYRDLEHDFKQAKLKFSKTIMEQKHILTTRDISLEQLASIKEEQKRIESMFEKEWTSIIFQLSQDVDLEQFASKVEEQKKEKAMVKFDLLGSI